LNVPPIVSLNYTLNRGSFIRRSLQISLSSPNNEEFKQIYTDLIVLNQWARFGLPICRLCRCCHYAAPLTHLGGCFSEILLVGFCANPCIVSSRDKTISRACLLSLWRLKQSKTLTFLTVIFIFSCSTKLLELIFFCMLTHDSRHFDAALYILHLERHRC